MTNKEVAETIFNKIRSFGFKPYNICYNTGYFIFEMGKDSVVKFKIKGLRAWLFGMWIETNPDNLKSDDKNGDDYPALQFFCQYQESIDKFKPSRSYFEANYSLNDIENPSEFEYYQIKEIIKSIKRHPFISYVKDEDGSDYFDKSYIKEYFRSRCSLLKCNAFEWIETWIPYVWTKIKIGLCNKNPILKDIKICDNNHDGWKTYPRFKLDILFNENSTNEKEIKFLNKWFKKNNYGQVSLMLHRVGIKGYYGYAD
jgi:hypothetical protein